MREIVFAVLAVAFISFSIADEDGHYRPELYGSNDGGQYFNQGNYYRAQNGKYKSLANNFGKYNSAINSNQPFYQAQQLNRQLLAPHSNYDNRFNQNYYSTSLPVVAYPTVIPAVTTIRPRVYSTTFAPIPQPTKLPVYSRTQYNSDKSANIIEQDSDSDGNSYRYSYQTDNGISAGESGSVDTSSGGGTRVRGFYEYIGDDGLKYRVDYTADENGFRPSGAHLVQP